jgi:hypothetical protein
VNEKASSGSELREAAPRAKQAFMHGLVLLSKAIATLATFSPLVLLAGIVILAFWWHEHNVRIRQGAQLAQLKKQTFGRQMKKMPARLTGFRIRTGNWSEARMCSSVV